MACDVALCESHLTLYSQIFDKSPRMQVWDNNCPLSDFQVGRRNVQPNVVECSLDFQHMDEDHIGECIGC